MESSLAACVARRTERRVTLNLDAVAVAPDGCGTAVVLVDVTQVGFRLRAASQLQANHEVLLQIPRIPAVRGFIQWVCGEEAGGVFVDPIAL